MRTNLFLLLFLVIATTLKASNLLRIPLEKGEKVEGTFSAEIGDNSLHLLYIKNKKTVAVELRGFFITPDGEILELEKAFYDKTPSLLSFHLSGEQLLLFNYLDKTIDHLRFDLKTGKKTSEQVSGIERPKYIIRHTEQTTFIRVDEETNSFSVSTFANTLQSTMRQIALPENSDGKKHWTLKANLSAVNQHEFVEKGAVLPGKLYLNKDLLTLTFTEDDLLKYVSFDLKTGTKYDGEFNHSPFSDNRNTSSFVYNNAVFKMDTQKEGFSIAVVDILSGDLVRTFNTASELSFLFPSDDQKKEYLKKIWKKNFVPTITVNSSIDGNAVVRIDKADLNTYSYYHDWWFHHFMFQHQMQMQMQMMQNQAMQSVPRFEPNPEYYELAGLVFNTTTSDTAYEFVLNNAFELIKNGNPETVYPYIEKKKFIDPYKNNTAFKHFSACFVKDEMRYLFLNKKLKTVFLNGQPIKK